MGGIDLLLQLDDDLYSDLSRAAEDSDRSVEDVIRTALLIGSGQRYEAPGPDADRVMRPMVTLDLRR